MSGPIFAIGGAEAKLSRRTVLRAFLKAAGGANARIVVIPTASSLGPEVMDVYDAAFTSLGAQEVLEVRPQTRLESDDPALVERIDRATGVFMTGGNQLKLTAVITGTPVGQAILRAHERGAVVGGTSAGCSILAEHMIAFGAAGPTPKQRMGQMAGGLGLVPGVILDQHFAQRNRYGRLLALVAQSPSLLGLGVDEDTAAVFTDDGLMTVVGRGAVTIVDGSHAISDAPTAQQTQPLLVSGVTMHVLPAGQQFHMASRTYRPHIPKVPLSEKREITAAAESLRQLARDIASEGADTFGYEKRKSRRRPSAEAS
ncbi:MULTISPECIES: cyanophycinase [Aestuariimicrobium]|uniref:cyanophycinase n=1 Tax=Aestuariimicrobium TaxID=396388 RepID=UPI0003B6B36C|nr:MULTISPECIES: cyanophycinase [Aestuariimicrobium]CAI9399041.1 Cyanophycinase [Aestuariimicrobium sp. T2.26MG-19.2B]